MSLRSATSGILLMMFALLEGVAGLWFAVSVRSWYAEGQSLNQLHSPLTADPTIAAAVACWCISGLFMWKAMVALVPGDRGASPVLAALAVPALRLMPLVASHPGDVHVLVLCFERGASFAVLAFAHRAFKAGGRPGLLKRLPVPAAWLAGTFLAGQFLTPLRMFATEDFRPFMLGSAAVSALAFLLLAAGYLTAARIQDGATPPAAPVASLPFRLRMVVPVAAILSAVMLMHLIPTGIGFRHAYMEQDISLWREPAITILAIAVLVALLPRHLSAATALATLLLTVSGLLAFVISGNGGYPAAVRLVWGAGAGAIIGACVHWRPHPAAATGWLTVIIAAFWLAGEFRPELFLAKEVLLGATVLTGIIFAAETAALFRQRTESPVK